MISNGTLLMCGVVLNRYLDVIAENPDCMTPEYKRLIVDAAMDVKRAREDIFMGISRSVLDVPTETDQASLLSVIARK
ncbi:MAG: hypothetical protein ABGX33_00615 [Cycloclasticus sp.]